MAKQQKPTQVVTKPRNQEKVSVKSIGRNLRKLIQKNKRSIYNVDNVIASMEYKRLSKDKNLRNKWNNEESIIYRATELMERFSDRGLKWSAAVQAVKTDYIPSLVSKMKDKPKLQKIF